MAAPARVTTGGAASQSGTPAASTAFQKATAAATMYVGAHVATQARQDLPVASHPPPQPAGATNHLNLPRPANAADAGADGDNESSDTDAASREEVAQNEERLKRSGQLLISAWTNTSAADGKRAAHVDARKWARCPNNATWIEDPDLVVGLSANRTTKGYWKCTVCKKVVHPPSYPHKYGTVVY